MAAQEFDLTPGTVKLNYVIGATWDLNFELVDIFGAAYPLAGKNITAIVEFEDQVIQVLKVGNGITVNGNVINLRKDNTNLQNGVYDPVFDELIEGEYITRMFIEESGKDSCFAILQVNVSRAPRDKAIGDVIAAPIFKTEMGSTVKISVKSIPDQIPDGSIKTNHIAKQAITLDLFESGISNVITDYYLQSIQVTNNKYIDPSGVEQTLAGYAYTIFECKDTDSIKITSQLSGANVWLIIYKNNSGLIIGKQYQGTNGVNQDYTDLLLSIPTGTSTIIINGKIDFTITVKRKQIYSKAVPMEQLDVLKTRTLLLENNQDNIKNILSDYIQMNIVVSNGFYVNTSLSQIPSISRSFTQILCKETDKVKVSSRINGSAVWLAIYLNNSGQRIGQQFQGLDGTDSTYVNQQLTIPLGTTAIIINGMVNTPIVVKKVDLVTKAATQTELDVIKATQDLLKVRLSEYAVQNINIINDKYINPSGTEQFLSGYSYTVITVSDFDQIKVTTRLSGNDAWLALYKNSFGEIIGKQFQGVNGVNQDYSEQLLTLPYGTSTIVINGKKDYTIVVKKLQLIEQAASVGQLDTLRARTSILENTQSIFRSVLSDFVQQSISVTSGYYIDTNLIQQPSSPRSFTQVTCKDSDQFKITSTINGGPVWLAIYLNSSGQRIGQQFQGTNGQDNQFIDQVLTIPLGTTSIIINGLITVPIIVKKMDIIVKSASQIELDSVKTRTLNLELLQASLKFILTDYVQQSINVTNDKYVNPSGVEQSLGSYAYTTLTVSDSDLVKVTTRLSGSDAWLAIYKNASGTIIGRQIQGVNGVNRDYIEQLLTLPAGTTTIVINGKKDYTIIVKKNQLITKAAQQESVDYIMSLYTTLVNRVNTRFSRWIDKVIFWLGTSIPAGGQYPERSALNLGATCINKAVGSSMVRISKADGSISGLAWQNVLYSLSATVAEKQSILDDWPNKRINLGNNPPVSFTQSEIDYILSCSYERRLIPYLDGTYQMPNLFVFDHGHNDNLSSDTDVIYTSVPSVRNDRTTFLGAMNFIIDLILAANPRARICFVGHYENDVKTRISTAQQVLANYWDFPLLKTWEKLGWSQQKVPNTAVLWTQVPYSNYSTSQDISKDMTVKRVWVPDDLHPHTDISGKAQELLTSVVTDYINEVV